MATKYLDSTGLTYLWTKIKNYIDSHSGGSGTSVPTADTLAEFDSSAHMNSTDMTSAEVDAFVASIGTGTLNVADYVVDEGTDGDWKYRKWNSGKYEAWSKFTGTKALTTSSRGMYYNATPFTVTFPSFSVSVVQTYATPTSSLSNGVIVYEFTETGNLNFRAFSSISSAICSAFLYIVGTWK